MIDKAELIGAVWARVFAENEQSYGFVDSKTPEFSIAIKEGYRNQGFGKRLMQKLFAKLKSKGFEKLSLSVDKRNPAVNLYRWHGFETVGEDGTALTMLKKL